MAAGVREMVRPNKVGYLQRIVRSLTSFKSSNMPSTSVNDEEFERFLNQGKVTISVETPQGITYPMRSQKPTDLNHIRHCIAFNVVMNFLYWHICTKILLENILRVLWSENFSTILHFGTGSE
uniref:Cytochrome P450 n=1 Tax=Ascaris lumbricoides TaxID=6252 RepID=A0A0M3IW78_ASCLU